jgi:dTDP-4-dehydrorhamnose 3,5-epimerase
MRIKESYIKGLFEIVPQTFKDDRGEFVETYNEEKLKDIIPYKFVQDNQSISKKGVFRGIHMQMGDWAQGKLVRVLSGAAIDYAIDLRPDSATFGQWDSVMLTPEANNQYWVPPGFGHAFLALEDNTTFCYKCTNLYNKESEECIKWDDADIYLEFLHYTGDILVSEKDEQGITLKDFKNKYC